MKFKDDILTLGERTVFALRKLYRDCGYTQYKMSKFEEYDLYAGNKSFLISDNVITFTDTDGKLMALKPDVTLSIVKNAKPEQGKVMKVFYNENVYRVSNKTHEFKEIMQTGLECIGDIDPACIGEVLTLAAKSLAAVSESYILEISHAGIIQSAIDSLLLPETAKTEIIKCIGEKNFGEIEKLCTQSGTSAKKLLTLLKLSGKPSDVLAKLSEDFSGDALEELAEAIANVSSEIPAEKIKIDFSLVGDMNYYNGIVMKGYIEGIPFGVLSGGEYGALVRKMGKNAKAIGFAVYLDELESLSEDSIDESDGFLNVALPKGRLGEKVYSMFERAGFECPEVLESSRKLIFENKEKKVRYFWVKPSDVAIYVERGAADVGVCGKDILLEYSPNIYELLDLKTGVCRMAVAAKNDFSDDTDKTLRVATKFKNIAKAHYRSLGREIDIIALNGSIEIAPILDLSDVIVDIVETGKTLKENNLSVIETIVDISARLIANKSSYRFKNESIEKIRESLSRETESKE